MIYVLAAMGTVLFESRGERMLVVNSVVLLGEPTSCREYVHHTNFSTVA